MPISLPAVNPQPFYLTPMKTTSTTLYSFNELSLEAQDSVIESVRNSVDISYIGNEILASLKAVCSACSLHLDNWSFGPWDRNYNISVSGGASELVGRKALAWFLRILLNHGYSRPESFKDMQFPGVCGFTGVCYDEDVVETVWTALFKGETVAKALDSVAYRFCKLWESEEEDARSNENILLILDRSAEIYTEDGEEF